MPPYGFSIGKPPINLNLSPTVYPLPPVDVTLLDSTAPVSIPGVPPEPAKVPVAVPEVLYNVYVDEVSTAVPAAFPPGTL